MEGEGGGGGGRRGRGRGGGRGEGEGKEEGGGGGGGGRGRGVSGGGAGTACLFFFWGGGGRGRGDGGGGGGGAWLPRVLRARCAPAKPGHAGPRPGGLRRPLPRGLNPGVAPAGESRGGAAPRGPGFWPLQAVSRESTLLGLQAKPGKERWLWPDVPRRPWRTNVYRPRRSSGACSWGSPAGSTRRRGIGPHACLQPPGIGAPDVRAAEDAAALAVRRADGCARRLAAAATGCPSRSWRTSVCRPRIWATQMPVDNDGHRHGQQVGQPRQGGRPRQHVRGNAGPRRPPAPRGPRRSGAANWCGKRTNRAEEHHRLLRQ